MTGQLLFPCPVCSATFDSQDELHEHTWRYQDEITTVLARLHDLLAHRDEVSHTTEASGDIAVERNKRSVFRANGRSQDNGFLDGTVDDLSPVAASSAAEKVTPMATETILECTHMDCSQRRSVYKRPQDLVRHYAIHVDCNEFCTFCQTEFTKASKYMNHKCISGGSRHQQDKTKERVRVLRKRTKALMNRKTARLPSDATTRRRELQRSETTTNIHRSMSLSPPRPFSNELMNFNQPESGARNGVLLPDQQSPHLKHPLFWPANTNPQSPIPGLPTPLWATPSACIALPSQFVPNNGPLYSQEGEGLPIFDREVLISSGEAS